MDRIYLLPDYPTGYRWRVMDGDQKVRTWDPGADLPDLEPGALVYLREPWPDGNTTFMHTWYE